MSKFITPGSVATVSIKTVDDTSYALITDPSRGMDYAVRLPHCKVSPLSAASLALALYKKGGVLELIGFYKEENVLQTHQIEFFN